MLITVSLPWNKAHATGRAFDVLNVEIQDSAPDGLVCLTGQAVSILTGDAIKLPPYIAVRDIPDYVGGLLGCDHGTAHGGRLD
jgi:hypothetical protein